jgi:hypothetical protein
MRQARIVSRLGDEHASAMLGRRSVLDDLQGELTNGKAFSIAAQEGDVRATFVVEDG